MTPRFRWLIATLAVVALLGAACGGDGGDGGTTPTQTTDGGGAATLELADFEFSPAALTVSSGDTITLENTGATPHTFTIADEGVDEQVEAGKTGEATIALDPGTYDFLCTLHESQGMVGTLTVE